MKLPIYDVGCLRTPAQERPLRALPSISLTAASAALGRLDFDAADQILRDLEEAQKSAVVETKRLRVDLLRLRNRHAEADEIAMCADEMEAPR